MGIIVGGDGLEDCANTFPPKAGDSTTDINMGNNPNLTRGLELFIFCLNAAVIFLNRGLSRFPFRLGTNVHPSKKETTITSMYLPYVISSSVLLHHILFIISFSIAPSRMKMVLSVLDERSELCVTNTIVLLNLVASILSNSKTSSPVFVSKFPVGSSA